jgi:hypothetical protein
MKLIGRLPAVVVLFALTASAQDDPLAWFPLQVGSRWVYDHEGKSGDRNRPEVEHWTTEETITGWATVPEGVVVLREVKETSNDSEPVTSRVIMPNGEGRLIRHQGNHANLIAQERAPYLIHGNCVYELAGEWDKQAQQLRAEYRKYLNQGELSPRFCFPLQPGARWGNNDVPWSVVPPRESVASILPAQYSSAIHIFSDHFGSGGWQDVWFEKGIGVVAEHYFHNGTYDEYTKTLRLF